METSTPQHAFPVVRAGIPPTAPLQWLAAGYADLKACGWRSLFYGLAFTVIGLLFVLAFRHAVQLLTAVSTGFMLLGPVLAMGLYELSRERERGEPPRLRPTLLVWRRSLGALGIFSLILIVLYLIWARASMVVFALFYQGGLPSIEGFIAYLLQFDNIDFIIAYLLVGGFFAILVFALSAVSIPLMLDRDQDAVTSMLASFLALARNPDTLLLWGLLIALLIGIGIATAFVGLIFTGPLLGHATWHAYRALIAPPPT